MRGLGQGGAAWRPGMEPGPSPTRRGRILPSTLDTHSPQTGTREKHFYFPGNFLSLLFRLGNFGATWFPGVLPEQGWGRAVGCERGSDLPLLQAKKSPSEKCVRRQGWGKPRGAGLLQHGRVAQAGTSTPPAPLRLRGKHSACAQRLRLDDDAGIANRRQMWGL